MANIVRGANNIVTQVDDIISSKKEFITKQIINSVLVMVIMVVFGCFDFAHPSFHFEYLADLSFWSAISGKVIAVVCAYNIGINFIIDEVIKQDKTLAYQKNLYESWNQYRDKDFDYYVDNIFNRELKIEAYKSKINHQIFLLNRISRKRDRLLYSSDDPTKQELKAKNRYCIRRAELEELKSDAFIEKNLESLNVRYKDVDPKLFSLEVDSRVRVNSVKVNGSLSKGRIQKTSTVIMSTVAITSFITALVLDPNKEEFENQTIAAMNYILKAVADVGTIIWQLLHGIFTAKDIVSEQLTQTYAGRNRVLRGYYAWRQTQGLWVPSAYTSLLKEKTNYVEIEMTQEEYDEFTKNSRPQN